MLFMLGAARFFMFTCDAAHNVLRLPPKRNDEMELLKLGVRDSSEQGASISAFMVYEFLRDDEEGSSRLPSEFRRLHVPEWCKRPSSVTGSRFTSTYLGEESSMASSPSWVLSSDESCCGVLPEAGDMSMGSIFAPSGAAAALTFGVELEAGLREEGAGDADEEEEEEESGGVSWLAASLTRQSPCGRPLTVGLDSMPDSITPLSLPLAASEGGLRSTGTRGGTCATRPCGICAAFSWSLSAGLQYGRVVTVPAKEPIGWREVRPPRASQPAGSSV